MLWATKMRSKYQEILSKERKEIKKRLKREKDPKVKLKLALLNMVASGMSVEDAASFLGIKLRTAYSWINKWIEEGYEAMSVKKRNLLNIRWGFLMKSRKNTIATQIKQIYHNLLSKY